MRRPHSPAAAERFYARQPVEPATLCCSAVAPVYARSDRHRPRQRLPGSEEGSDGRGAVKTSVVHAVHCSPSIFPAQ